MPPLAEIPAGCYPMGEDEPFVSFGDAWSDHMPRHEVRMAAFRIGRFPVTNAEWAHFMEAGGYEDERWWDTPGGRKWRTGEGVSWPAGTGHRSVEADGGAGKPRRETIV